MSPVIVSPREPWVYAMWRRYEHTVNHWRADDPRAVHLGVPELGFLRYRPRRDGTSVIDVVLVDEAARGQGLAKVLVLAVPRPIQVKTDVDNGAANALYRSIGAVLLGTHAKLRAPGHVNVYYLP